MQINKSPFHISNRDISNNHQKKVTEAYNLENKSKEISNDNEGNSFWSWFRGLVNPFQNLPLISGIYSSMNSEDTKSDRDLVQNSLGGFIYGGPIGAIAGFGNWIFNKIFDKTPSELAMDITGISNLWKNNKNDESEFALKENLKSNVTKNESTKIVRNDSTEWWNKNLSNFSKFKSNDVKKEKKLTALTNFDSMKILKSEDNLVSLSNKYKLTKNIHSEKKVLSDVKFNLKAPDKLKLSDNNLNSEFEKVNNSNNKFREINFNYPEWKPNNLELGKNSVSFKSKDILNKKYLDLKNEQKESKLNMKL